MHFPGGTFVVEDYERWLSHDAMQAPTLPDGVLHPAWIVLGALRGMGITLDDFIELAGATPDDGVVFGETDYEQHALLRSDTEYTVRGGIASVTRREGKRARRVRRDRHRADRRGPGGHRGGGLAAVVHLLPRAGRGVTAVVATACRSGASSSRPTRMKVFSVLMRDPNPVHFDPAFVQSLGLGDRPVNQGTITMGYPITAVLEWAGGPERVVAFRCRFLRTLLAEDEAIAGGEVTALETGRTAGRWPRWRSGSTGATGTGSSKALRRSSSRRSAAP